MALRPKPRESLSFRVESQDPDTLCGLLARVDAALKAGLGCCPGWGRGIPLVAASGASVSLFRAAWDDVQAGSYLFLAVPGGGGGFEVAEVASVDGNALAFTGTLAFDWSAGGWAWPLVFGRPTSATSSTAPTTTPA